MSTTHLAGNRVIIGQYSIQRCLLCGEVLQEENFSQIAVCSESPRTAFGEMVVGGFYRKDGNMTILIEETEQPYFESDLDLPEDCCVRQKK